MHMCSCSTLRWFIALSWMPRMETDSQPGSRTRCRQSSWRNSAPFVRRNAHVPLLVHYQPDATLSLTSTSSATRSFDGKMLDISRRHISEYILERAFVCARPSGATTHESTVLVLLPRSLERGKGALQCFSASVASAALPRQYGHLHRSCTQYCFDGAQFDAQFRLAQQRHGG